MFNYRWLLSDLHNCKHNGLDVFSCFSCGGGSTMGYKLAGFNVVGCVELASKMMEVYKANHSPALPYHMDIREFNNIPNNQLPQELFSLDILDGSPPCSTFSLAGVRERKWGKENHFKEGQIKQQLDTLFFEFIDTAKKLKPKIIVAENVVGILGGHAKGYVSEILSRLKEIEYETQVFTLNSGAMGIPQARERVFFISRKVSLNLPNLKLQFNYAPIPYRNIKSQKPGQALGEHTVVFKMWAQRRYGDIKLSQICERTTGKGNHYTTALLYDDRVVPTIVSQGNRYIRFDSPHSMSDEEIIFAQSFPMDYNFLNTNPQYVCGMSVPPVMMAHVAQEIKKQWLFS